MTDFAAIKENARKMWSTFAAFETVTGLAAPELVKFAGVQKGDHERALELHSQLLAFWNACDLENLPACVKYAQTLQGLPETYPRRPMPEARPEARVRIQKALQNAGVLK